MVKALTLLTKDEGRRIHEIGYNVQEKFSLAGAVNLTNYSR